MIMSILILLGVSMSLILYSCVSLLLIMILTVVLLVISTWDELIRLLRVNKCSVCGIEIPRGYTDSTCTFCREGYLTKNIPPDQQKDMDINELKHVGRSTH